MSIAVLILSALAAPPTKAPGAEARAAAVEAGNVFVCEFEEPDDRDYDGWPDGWTRARSRELPEFLKIGIAPEASATTRGPQSAAGAAATPRTKTAVDDATSNRCLLIELDGGGAMVASPPRPVSPQFSLVLTLRIKVEGLAHDGAWATLDLLDAEGNVLQSHGSAPLTTAKGWQAVRIGPIAAVSNKAARAVVSLHVAPLGKQEDLTGRAWFDDIRVVRLPRMTLASNGAPSGLYTNPDTAELVCEVSGIRVRNPQVRFELFDHTGQRLAEYKTPLLSPEEAAKTSAALPEDGYAGHANWSPPLPDFGYYHVRASLVAEDAQEVLLDRSQSVAVLRPLGPIAHSEYGWTLTGDEKPYAFGPLAMLLGQAGLGWAKMPVWYDSRDASRADRIAWFAEQLSIQGIELVGVLDQPPAELREVFREQGRLPMATVFAEPELWQPAVGPVMTRLSLKVRWWQLGDDNDVSFIGYPQLDGKVAEIKRHLEQYGQQVNVGLSWRWVYSQPPSSGQRSPPWAYLSYGIEPPLTADELGAYLQAAGSQAAASGDKGKGRGKAPSDPAPSKPGARRPSTTSDMGRREVPALQTAVTRRAPGGPQSWLTLPPLARGDYSTVVRVQDLVTRMLAAKIHGAKAIFIPQPFSDEQGVMNSDGSPGELLIPWRTTAAIVGGAEYLGPLQLPGGSMSHVFGREGKAAMVVWSERPATEYVFLGDEVEQIDVWGRATRPELVDRDGRKLHELKIGTMPTFVTGLSEAVARCQAGMNFENVQLASVAGRQQTIVLRLPNTFKQGVSGELLLNAPKSWEVDTRPTRFKIAEGEELRLPLNVTILADANSGPQPIRLDVEIAAQKSYRFSVYRTLQLGLDDVQVELSTRLRKDGALLVEEHLTNLSDRPLSFQCLLFAPGRRRETRQVINLTRDGTNLAFVLPRGEELIGKKLWLRAEEIGGSRVLNYTLTAER